MLAKRAARFGIAMDHSKADSADKEAMQAQHAELKAKRAARFGSTTSTQKSEEEDSVRAKRLARFQQSAPVDPEEEARREARAARFKKP